MYQAARFHVKSAIKLARRVVKGKCGRYRLVATSLVFFVSLIAGGCGRDDSRQQAPIRHPGAANQTPIARDDELRIGTGAVTLPLLSNDTDPDGDKLTLTILTQPRGGTVTVVDSNVATFYPENAFSGPTKFTYRITDPAGASAFAVAHLVVGNFPGVVFVSDETFLGTPELYFYDGLHTAKLNAPLGIGEWVQDFAFAGDAHHIAYVVPGPSFHEVFLADLGQPGSAHSIYRVANTDVSWVSAVLNRDATFAMLSIRASNGNVRHELVRVADARKTEVGASTPGVYLVDFGGFNPLTEEYYFKGWVNSQSFATLFAGTTSAPDVLTQIGGSFPGAPAGGGGLDIRISNDGRRVFHTVATFKPSTGELRVDDRETGTESGVYGTQIGKAFYVGQFDLAPGDERLCLELNDTFNPDGASRIWYVNTASPDDATALTPQGIRSESCRWGSDGDTVVYLVRPQIDPISGELPGRTEPWVVNIGQPGVVQRLREPLTGTEEFDSFGVAKKTNTAVVGVQPYSRANPDFYRVALDAPGHSVKFATGSLLTSTANTLKLDAWGSTLIYTSSGQLHLLSSQTLDYDIALSRPDSIARVELFEYVPVP